MKRVFLASAHRSNTSVVLCCCALALLACNQRRAIPGYARLTRSNAVDFACIKDNTTVIKRSDCRVPTPDPSLKLYAFVSQSARGEVATIDLGSRALLDSRPDIPGYTFVPVGESPVSIVVPPNHPEHTYVANYGTRDVYVFDTTALVPPATTSRPIQKILLKVMTTSGEVSAAPTQMVLDSDESALLLAVPELGRVIRLPIQRCAIDQADCLDGKVDVAATTSVDLQGSIALPPANDPPPSAGARYEELCSLPRPTIPDAPALSLSPAQLTAKAHPRWLAVDGYCRSSDAACKRRLIVADDALPLLHVIDLDAFAQGAGTSALMNPIAVGTPTREVVVTPRVPVAIGDSRETQYLYAIDASDGSVLVVEGSRVLNVNGFPDPRPDRIELPNTDGSGPPSAETLAVLTPDFNPEVPSSTQYLLRGPATLPEPSAPNFDLYCPQPDQPFQDASYLRGVFIAVALSDGTVRLVDVHDMTLAAPPTSDGTQTQPCRQCAKTPVIMENVPIPLLVRHHLRLGPNPEGLVSPTLLPVPQTLAFITQGQQYPLRADGTSASPDAPSLDCLACDGLSQVLPRPDVTDTSTTSEASASAAVPTVAGTCPTKEKPSLLCTVTDPWSNVEDYWTANYEGLLPGALGGDATFSAPGSVGNRSGAPEIDATLDFCARGVLGDEDITRAYANDTCDASVMSADVLGDQLTILSPLLDSSGTDCAAARQALEADAQLSLSFGIRRAYRDHVVIASRLALKPSAPEALVNIADFASVQRCVGGGPMSFMVRTRDAFVVEGLRSGFHHQVAANGAGRCELPPTATSSQQGRARRGCVFSNGLVAWHMHAPVSPDDVPSQGTSFTMRLRSPFPPLYFNGNSLGYNSARVLPVALSYLDVTRGLYLVDIHERGLVPIPAGDAPFPTAIDATLTVN